MPVYEYKCQECGSTETVKLSVSERDNSAPRCTHRGVGHPMKRMVSRTNFALKGEGWYKDGYQKKD